MSKRGSRREGISGEELRRQLSEDPDYAKLREAIGLQQLEALARYRKHALPVLTGLAQAGFPVEYVGELQRARLNYASAIPVLLKWLPRVRDPAVKQDIVRSLTVKWAKPAAALPLIGEFNKLHLTTSESGGLADPIGSLKWAIGNALEVVADDGVFSELVKIAGDKKHGRTREMVVVALGNMRDPAAVDVLLELLNDEQVAGHAVIALGKLKTPKAKADLRRFLSHEKDWVRQEAKRAIAKIERAEERTRDRRMTARGG